MDLQTIFTGAFALTLFVSAVLTTLFSFFLLWLYRRAVVRGMNLAAGVTGVAPPEGALLPPSYPLRITKMSRGFKAIPAQDSSRIDRAMTLSLRRVALAYTAAGLAFALFFAAADQVEMFGNIRPIPFLVSTIVFAWPIVLALSLLVALGSRDRLRFVLFYLAVFVVVGIFATSMILHQSPLSLVLFWLLSNGLATLLLLAFLTRRVRAVGPLVLVFMIAGVAGAVLLPLAVGSSSYSTQRGLVGAFEAVGLGGLAAFYAIFLFGFAALAILGWGLLRLIGRRYRQKRMSDQSLTLDAMWLLFAMSTPSIWQVAAGSGSFPDS